VCAPDDGHLAEAIFNGIKKFKEKYEWRIYNDEILEKFP
jgi:hypothetical protein